MKVCPTTATATYASSDEKVATVDADGKITGVAAGEATITATTDYGKTATAKVAVKKVYLKSVKQTEVRKMKLLLPVIQAHLRLLTSRLQTQLLTVLQ